MGSSAQLVEFNVPPSTGGGATVSPHPSEQYAIDNFTRKSTNGGTGNDWSVYRVFPNSETGLLPHEAQGAFDVVRNLGPSQIRITGFGADFNDPTRNFAQQTHVGPNAGSSGTTMRYQTDTEGGNSGSPVIDEATGQAVGVHTHGGCSSGNNSGTSTFHTNFWNALNPRVSVTLTPSASPVVLPASGGSVTMQLQVTNNKSNPRPVGIWSRATQPSGGMSERLYGPTRIDLPGNTTRTFNITVDFPAVAAPGYYGLWFKAGDFYQNVLGFDAFPVYKMPTRAGGPVAEGEVELRMTVEEAVVF